MSHFIPKEQDRAKRISQMAENTPVLVSEEVRQIVREEVSTALKQALAEIPTRAEMTTYVDGKIGKSNEATNALIKSVDEHLRVQEYAGSQTKSAVDRMAGVLDGVAQLVKASAAHLDNLQDEVSDQREEITLTQGRIDHFGKAVFGDPDTPGVISLQEAHRQRSERADAQHSENMRAVQQLTEKLDREIAPLKQYIVSRQQFESRVINTFRWFMNHPKLTAAILAPLGLGIGIDALKQITDTIAQVFQTVTP